MRLRFSMLPLALALSLLTACGTVSSRRVSRTPLPNAGLPLTKMAARASQTSCDTNVAAAAPLASGSHEATISSAYRDVLREFLRSLDPTVLLNAAWQGATDEAAAEGDTNPGVAAPQLDGSSSDDAWNSFAAAYDQLSSLTEGQVDQQRMAFAAVNQMAESVKEGHTYFVDPQEYGQMSAGVEQHISGIGVLLNSGSPGGPKPPGNAAPTGPFVIEAVVSGAPADQAGIKPGDAIVGVDGCDVTGWNSLKLSTHVRGTAGTSVHLTLDRDSAGTYDVDVTRAQVTFPAVEQRLLPSGVGYLHLTQFPSPTAVLTDGKPLGPDFDSILAGFQGAGARGWILDLRDDGGGAVPGLQVVGGAILPSGTIFSMAGRDGGRVPQRTIGNRATSPPLLAVLVNGQSASASEILAAAVQDEGIAPIIGSPTAGVANAAELLGIGDGAGMSVTHWQTYLPTGTPIQNGGVTPDITVDRTREDLAAGVDPPLDAALALAPSPSASNQPSNGTAQP
jgi:carboxyl-terminal processing protease